MLQDCCRRVGRAIAAAGVLLCAAGALAQPANDLCSSPEVIPNTTFPLVINGDNTGATSDQPFTCASIDDDDIDVWYTLTAATAGQYTFEAVGDIGFLDPTVSLWSDCFNRLACDDNGGGGFTARLTRTLAAGETVLVRVGAMSLFTDFGTFSLTVTLSPSGGANNDTCGTAASITTLPYSDTRDLFTATDDLDTSCNDNAAPATRNGRWYTFTPAGDQVVRFETSGAANVVIAVYTGACAAPTPVVCQGGSGLLPTVGVTVPLTGGTTYRILVGEYGASALTATKTVTLTATQITPEVNDQCAGAIAVAALPFTDEIVFPNASIDRDVTCNSTTRNNAVTHNGVWYTYTAPAAQQLQFALDPGVSSGSVALAVFTGSCAAPTEVACLSTFPATFNAAAGTTYRILVGAGSQLGATFSRTLSISIPNPPPANDLCTGAIALTAGVAANGDNTNATATNDGPNPSAVTCQSAITKSVWYSFTPSSTGDYSVSTCGSPQDTVLSVLTGACGSQTIIACDDDSCSAPTDFASNITSVTLTAGTTYFIRVSSFNPGAGPIGGAYTVVVAPLAATGACCRGATCSIDSSTTCTGFATQFAGANTVCSAFGVNNTTPCCLADFNQVGGITVQDIFDYLGAYFSGSASADINGGGVSVQDIFDYLSVYFVGGC